jgi:hypothetical protein
MGILDSVNVNYAGARLEVNMDNKLKGKLGIGTGVFGAIALCLGRYDKKIREAITAGNIKEDNLTLKKMVTLDRSQFENIKDSLGKKIVENHLTTLIGKKKEAKTEELQKLIGKGLESADYKIYLKAWELIKKGADLTMECEVKYDENSTKKMPVVQAIMQRGGDAIMPALVDVLGRVPEEDLQKLKDVFKQEIRYGVTPMKMVMNLNNPEIMEAMINVLDKVYKDDKVSFQKIFVTQDGGTSPVNSILHEYVRRGNHSVSVKAECINALIEGLEKAYVNDKQGLQAALTGKNSHGETPLSLIVQHGDGESVKHITKALAKAWKGNPTGLVGALIETNRIGHEGESIHSMARVGDSAKLNAMLKALKEVYTNSQELTTVLTELKAKLENLTIEFLPTNQKQYQWLRPQVLQAVERELTAARQQAAARASTTNPPAPNSPLSSAALTPPPPPS